jgi:peptidylamidoglycolate lyase
MKRIALILIAVAALAQTGGRVTAWGDLPAGLVWADASSVNSNGANVFVLRRAAPNVVELTLEGKFVWSWGDNSLYSVAHSIDFDRDGNVWTTDSLDHVVYKFDRDGKLLLTLGKRKVPGDNATQDLFNRPSDVAFAPNGDVFITDGYENSRIVKLDKNGKFIKIIGGTKGSGAGEFNLPHAVVIDSRGRLLIADRENERIVVMDQDGKFIDQWKGLSKPSGLAIAKDDTISVSDVDRARSP